MAKVKKLWESYREREIVKNPQIEETLNLDDYDEVARGLEVVYLQNVYEYEAYTSAAVRSISQLSITELNSLK